jgi:hypothetical protein
MVKILFRCRKKNDYTTRILIYLILFLFSVISFVVLFLGLMLILTIIFNLFMLSGLYAALLPSFIASLLIVTKFCLAK